MRLMTSILVIVLTLQVSHIEVYGLPLLNNIEENHHEVSIKNCEESLKHKLIDETSVDRVKRSENINGISSVLKNDEPSHSLDDDSSSSENESIETIRDVRDSGVITCQCGKSCNGKCGGVCCGGACKRMSKNRKKRSITNDNQEATVEENNEKNRAKRNVVENEQNVEISNNNDKQHSVNDLSLEKNNEENSRVIRSEILPDQNKDILTINNNENDLQNILNINTKNVEHDRDPRDDTEATNNFSIRTAFADYLGSFPMGRRMMDTFNGTWFKAFYRIFRIIF